MKIIFLDFDGVLNSTQSAIFWHNKRDQDKWENELYAEWQGTLYEYLALEFCPIALSNMEELVRRTDAKIVVSSTWRLHNDIDDLKKILAPAKIVANAVFDRTPRIQCKPRGEEIKAWLDQHPEVEQYVIVDDDRDMLPEQQDNFVNTSPLHGFLFGDMISAERILSK